MTTTASVMYVVDSEKLTDVKPPPPSWQASGVDEVRRVLRTVQEIARARQEAVARGEDPQQMPWLVFTVEDFSAVLSDAECSEILGGLMPQARSCRTLLRWRTGTGQPRRQLRRHQKAALTILAALVLLGALWGLLVHLLPFAVAVCLAVVFLMATSTLSVAVGMRNPRRRPR